MEQYRFSIESIDTNNSCINEEIKQTPHLSTSRLKCFLLNVDYFKAERLHQYLFYKIYKIFLRTKKKQEVI